jgi:hypothetical protein
MTFGQEFLLYPDLFPARQAGEPWGDRCLVIDLAGGPYRFEGMTGEQAGGVESRFGRLCQSPAPGDPGDRREPATVTRVFRAPLADFLPIDTRGWEYTLDLAHEPASVQIAGLHLMARLDWSPDLGAALWTPEEPGELFAPVLENLFRALFAYRLQEIDGALVHSAGVVVGERAFLLIGPSGAGKTTASRLCLERGGGILSDDLNAVRLAAGTASAWVEKLPFTGDLGAVGELGSGGSAAAATGRWPLGGLLRLVQGAEDRVQPLSRGAALATLLAASPIVNRDPFRRDALAAFLERIAFAVPAWELTFSLGGGLWDILTNL